LTEVELFGGAIEGGFVADEQIQGFAAVGQVAEGEGEAVVVLDSFA
jgi:hypothetical protein